MSQYTTGEMAKACQVTVRTVQYYDTRGILTPSALSEGGRRLYSEDDLRRLKVICFLRSLGLSIDTIGQLLAESDPGAVVSLLLAQQEQALRGEIREREEKLGVLAEVRRAARGADHFSVEDLGDIASTMDTRKNLTRLHRNMILTGLPVSILQIAAIVLWIAKGIWWPFLVWAAVAIPYGVLVSRKYFRSTAYICPQCHEVFRPTFKEAFFAAHTPRTRKLTCPKCGRRGFCVETWNEAQ